MTALPWASRSRASRAQSTAFTRFGTRSPEPAATTLSSRAFTFAPRRIRPRLAVEQIRRLGYPCAFPPEQRELPLETPAIARQSAVAAHDAMAGNRHGAGLGGAGLAHFFCGRRRAWPPSYVGVAFCRAGRDLLQRAPDLLLEGRSAHFQRHIEAHRRRGEEARHLRDEWLQLGAGTAECRLRKMLPQIARQSVSVVAEQDGAHATVALGDEHDAEDAFAGGIEHFLIHVRSLYESNR